MKPFPADRTSTSEPEVVVHLFTHSARTILILLSLLLAVFVVGAWSATSAGTITISITPANVTVSPGGTQQFSALMQGTANTGVKWSVSAGSITNTGLFTAPKVNSNTAVTITVTSIADPKQSASATVAVVNQSSPAINTVNIPMAVAGESYAFNISVSGGKTPYQWSIASGSMPSGIQLNNSGMLSGTTKATGQFSFTVRVSDAAGHADSQSFNMNVQQQGNSPLPPQQGNFDGPAELPRVYIDSSMANTPSSGQSWNLAAGDSLQDALNNASCGDTIYLQAGATFEDNFTVPAKNCDDAHWITVRTSASDSALPAEGTRITPCYAGVASLTGRPSYKCSNPKNVMAKLVVPKIGTGPIVFAPNANHYRFVGLEVTRNQKTGIVYALISMTPGYPADHLVFDRMWIHGTAQDETTKGIQLGGSTYVAIVDSYINDLHCISRSGSCTDSVAVGGGIGNNPTGPYRIVDNYLEAAGENILFGGAAATVTPADIEVRGNHMFKPLIWMKGQPGYVGGRDGNPFIVKNLFELKNAQRVLLEGNVMENSWGGFSQTGFGIVITPKNQSNGQTNVCPICQVTDLTIRYGSISHVASGMQIGNGLSDTGGAPLDGERYSIHDVVIDDINGTMYNGAGMLAQVSMGKGAVPVLQHVTLEHITAFSKDAMLNVGDKTTSKMSDFNFLNNVVLATDRPFTTTGGTDNCAAHVKPLVVLPNCFDPYQFTSNALIGVPGTDPPDSWPSGNYFPPSPKGMFVNYNGGNGGDYHLVQGSPYTNAGSDGKNLGADIDAIAQYTANSR
jgi:Putative Ig domain